MTKMSKILKKIDKIFCNTKYKIISFKILIFFKISTFFILVVKCDPDMFS